MMSMYSEKMKIAYLSNEILDDEKLCHYRKLICI